MKSKKGNHTAQSCKQIKAGTRSKAVIDTLFPILHQICKAEAVANVHLVFNVKATFNHPTSKYKATYNDNEILITDCETKSKHRSGQNWANSVYFRTGRGGQKNNVSARNMFTVEVCENQTRSKFHGLTIHAIEHIFFKLNFSVQMLKVRILQI